MCDRIDISKSEHNQCSYKVDNIFVMSQNVNISSNSFTDNAWSNSAIDIQ